MAKVKNRKKTPKTAGKKQVKKVKKPRETLSVEKTAKSVSEKKPKKTSEKAPAKAPKKPSRKTSKQAPVKLQKPPLKKHYLQTAGRLIKVFLLRLGILVLAAILLTWYLQYRFNGNDASYAWWFMDDKPYVFWYSSLIIFCMLMLIYGLFRGPWKSIAILFAGITIITYINIAKMNFRGTPLLPEDFQLTDQAGTLTKFIDVGELVRMILTVILALGLGFFLDYLTKDYLSLPQLHQKNLKKWQKTALFLAPRIIIIPLALAGLISTTDFIRHHDGAQAQEVPWLHMEFLGWGQTENYRYNGFLFGFLYNLEKFELAEPEGYSEQKMAEIYQRYNQSEPAKTDPVRTETAQTDTPAAESSEEAQLSLTTTTKNTSLKDSDVNIIIILNESFYDPSLIRDVYNYYGLDDPDQDVTPVLHEIQKNYPSGYMYSPDYGGGTATIEFEVLTGLSNYWAQTVPYTDLIPKMQTLTAIGNTAKAAGYQTTAIHSFTGSMYKRTIALPKEGFDRFITEDEMTHQEHDGHSDYINDRSVYQETLDILNSTDQKQLITTITMQNHAGYLYENYDPEDYEFGVEGFGAWDGAPVYLQTVHNSDRYLGEFLDALKKVNKKTAVVFFGDHAPGVFPLVHENENKDIADLSHLTPYFVWTNYAAPDTYSDKKYGEEFLKNFGSAFSYDEDAEFAAAELNEYYSKLKETYGPPTADDKPGYGLADDAYEYFYDSDKDQYSARKTVYYDAASDSYKGYRYDVFAELSKNVNLPTTTPNCLLNALYGVTGLEKDAFMSLLSAVCAEEPILTPTYLGSRLPKNTKALESYEYLNYDILGGDQFWLKLAK